MFSSIHFCSTYPVATPDCTHDTRPASSPRPRQTSPRCQRGTCSSAGTVHQPPTERHPATVRRVSREPHASDPMRSRRCRTWCRRPAAARAAGTPSRRTAGGRESRRDRRESENCERCSVARCQLGAVRRSGGIRRSFVFRCN